MLGSLVLRKYHTAIVDATGLVGQELVRILEQRNFPVASIHLFASDRSVGSRMWVNHREVEVRELTANSFDPVDIALFAGGDDISRSYAPTAAKRGAVVIDSSGAFRMNPRIPLIVPEVNAEDMENHRGLIANPNSSTIQLVVALSPLHKINPIKRIIVESYQSVSGTGKAAVDELNTQSKAVLEGKSTIPHVYHHQIAFNLLPEIDVFMDDGYTREEWKLTNETRKILRDNNLKISATCIRVPVITGNSMSIHVELTNPMFPEEARNVLANAPGVRVLDNPSISHYPHPWAVVGSDEVFVGRIRQDASYPNGLAMWVVADNLRKGAALNAVQIAEELIARGWI